jgi:carbonic anhydrase
MSRIDALLEHAATYAETYPGGLQTPPVKQIAVVACMDSRMLPSRLLGVLEGDAHIIRNAGGVVTDDVIRSLAISQHLLGTRSIMLLHHTDCGLLKVTDDEFRGRLEEATGVTPDWSAHAFSDIEGSVRRSIAQLHDSPFIPHTDDLRGFVFDVESGVLREVAP